MNKKLLSIEDCHQLNINEIKKLYKNHISNALVSIFEGFSFGNETVKYAEGQYIYTNQNKKILDFTGGLGVLNIGHNNPKIISERINYQKSKRMEVYKNYLSPYLAGLSHNIAEILPSDLNYSFFCNSGSEAIDGSIKIAYKYHNGNRKYILHSNRSFHGKLLSSLSVSKDNYEISFPKLAGTHDYEFNNLDSLNKKISNLKKNNGQSDVYAILVEPFSASSMTSNSKEFMQGVRKLCDRHDIVLIFDEIYTGFYKTGKLFYFENFDLVPDVLVLSKSLGGGKSSISGYISRNKIAKKSYDNMSDVLMHSTTYNGFGEECITAISAINQMIENNYENKSSNIGKELNKELKKLKELNPKKIKDVRGAGCLYGLVLKIDSLAIKSIKIMPSKFLADEKFIDKLVITAIMEELYTKHNILTTFKDNTEVILCVEPSIISTKEDIIYFTKCLDQVLNKNIVLLVSNLLKNKIKNNNLFLHKP